MRFEVLATDPHSGLRAGMLHMPHGTVETPTFMPVGTLGTVKSLTPRDVVSTGARIVLANTYHLLLQPGVETVERLGGLHGLMRWDGPILTDSGGFQVFSLGVQRDVSNAGVTFASHLDGSPMCLTPESVIDAEERLGADIIMPLDECLGAAASRTEAEAALERTQHWWRRSIAARTRCDQALFHIVQGGLFADLRRQAACAAAREDAPGFAIGGLSIGEPKEKTAELLDATLPELPAERARYLMGVGHPLDVVNYARQGIDMFDCVLPTRLARNGSVWCDELGTRLDLNKRTALEQVGPIASGCDCLACREWSVGALAALFQARETLAYRLASMHNVRFLSCLLSKLRGQVLYTARVRADVD